MLGGARADWRVPISRRVVVSGPFLCDAPPSCRAARILNDETPADLLVMLPTGSARHQSQDCEDARTYGAAAIARRAEEVIE